MLGDGEDVIGIIIKLYNPNFEIENEIIEVQFLLKDQSLSTKKLNLEISDLEDLIDSKLN
jgi:hypothetical protein